MPPPMKRRGQGVLGISLITGRMGVRGGQHPQPTPSPPWGAGGGRMLREGGRRGREGTPLLPKQQKIPAGKETETLPKYRSPPSPSPSPPPSSFQL